MMVTCTVVYCHGIEHIYRAVQNAFHLGGATLLAEVENKATVQSFSLGGLGAYSPRKIRCSEVHSGAF